MRLFLIMVVVMFMGTGGLVATAQSAQTPPAVCTTLHVVCSDKGCVCLMVPGGDSPCSSPSTIPTGYSIKFGGVIQKSDGTLHLCIPPVWNCTAGWGCW